MPSPSAVAEISSPDVAWLKQLKKEGIGAWVSGNRPLTTEEFERVKKLIRDHSLPVELQFDCNDVWFISIYVPPSLPGVRLESRKDSVLELAGDNVPGYVYAKRHSNDYAEESLVPLARNARNCELLELYGLESPD